MSKKNSKPAPEKEEEKVEEDVTPLKKQWRKIRLKRNWQTPRISF